MRGCTIQSTPPFPPLQWQQQSQSLQSSKTNSSLQYIKDPSSTKAQEKEPKMLRIAQIVHLKPSALAVYKDCHANVWPEVLQQIKECNIRDCISLSPFLPHSIHLQRKKRGPKVTKTNYQTQYSTTTTARYSRHSSTSATTTQVTWRRCVGIRRCASGGR